VYPHTAQVLLINDQTSGLGAIVERLRLQGIVRGSPNGETMLEKVMADEEVKEGDRVITTGGDGIFPKGLPVGNVVKVSPSDLFLRIRLHPAADLSRLEEVLVITKMQEVAPAAGDVAGSQRAVDILAARLPGVPEKPVATETGAKTADGSESGAPAAGTSTPGTSPAPPHNPPREIPQAARSQPKPAKGTKTEPALKPAIDTTGNNDRMQ
jgi:rod shape-determining protein MreC